MNERTCRGGVYLWREKECKSVEARQMAYMLEEFGRKKPQGIKYRGGVEQMQFLTLHPCQLALSIAFAVLTPRAEETLMENPKAKISSVLLIDLLLVL